MTNAERQKRYRDRRKNGQFAKSVTSTPENVPNPGVNVTENPPEALETRANTISTPVPATPDSDSGTRIASIEDYYANRSDYAALACPELLNWGEPMSVSELSEARLSGNRIRLPGDWDYVAEEST